MQQAKANGSNKTVTKEAEFFGEYGEEGKRACIYREGVPVQDALEHAAMLVDSVMRGLKEIAHEKDETGRGGGTFYCMSIVLENAAAAIDASLSGVMHAR